MIDYFPLLFYANIKKTGTECKNVSKNYTNQLATKILSSNVTFFYC